MTYSDWLFPAEDGEPDAHSSLVEAPHRAATVSPAPEDQIDDSGDNTLVSLDEPATLALSSTPETGILRPKIVRVAEPAKPARPEPPTRPSAAAPETPTREPPARPSMAPVVLADAATPARERPAVPPGKPTVVAADDERPRPAIVNKPKPPVPVKKPKLADLVPEE